MIWYVCFFIMLAVGLAAAAVSAYLLLSKYKKGRRLSVLQVLVAFCFLAAVLLCIPPYTVLHAGDAAGVLKTVVFTFQDAVSVFGGDSLYKTIEEAADTAPRWLADTNVTLALILQLAAPMLSVGFLLSFFKNLSAYIKYTLSYFRDVFVFSERNEKSMALAKDILRNHSDARIIFAGTDDKEASDLAETAKEMGAICFKKDITALRLGFHSKSSRMCFFAMRGHEAGNVNDALKLIESYKTRSNTRLYIFSTGVEGELLLAGTDKGCMKVRRVNEVRSLISRVLYEEGEKIFGNAAPIDGSRDKQISAVIVGMGNHGTEMLKSLVWFCQMDGYHVKINGVDKDPLAGEKFAALCPELMSEQYNGVTVPEEAEYSITVHSGCDVTSKKFADVIASIRDASYVFISLGSDEANIRAAVDLRMRFERIGAKPIIQAVIASGEAKQALRHVRNSAGQPYNISFIGDIESSFSERVILRSDIEQDAFERHKAYCDGDPEKEEDFWRYEYCYRSSMATAIHAHARILCGIPGAVKQAQVLTDAEKEQIKKLEHRRWNAYMRSEGYVYSGSPDASSRNDLAKMHHNLVSHSVLSDEDKSKDLRIGAKV